MVIVRVLVTIVLIIADILYWRYSEKEYSLDYAHNYESAQNILDEKHKSRVYALGLNLAIIGLLYHEYTLGVLVMGIGVILCMLYK